MIDKTLKDEDGNDVTTRNLFVIKLMTSLKSRGFVKEQFNWQWYYWFITDEGIEYLRKYLNIPAEVLPKTYKQPKVPDRPIGGGGFGGRGGRGFGGGDGGRGYGRGGPRRGDDRVRDAYVSCLTCCECFGMPVLSGRFSRSLMTHGVLFYFFFATACMT